jgi:2-(1,2-epoxy-1,2-dihydrophenyl)acetyl-CoA isomerase
VSASDVTVEIGDDLVATVEITRGPNNYFNPTVIADLADAFERLDDDPRCRAIVLCSQGKHFCAGADFTGEMTEPGAAGRVYEHGVRLFGTSVPVVAAVQGAAIGGGVGLALAADFRVATPASRFAANFARLGFHQGFGISVTLPHVVGPTRAAELLFSGRNVSGAEAKAIGLCDELAEPEELRARARAFVGAFVDSAPQAVRAIKQTLRRDLAERVRAIVGHELAEQTRLRRTEDFREGIRASSERRAPRFTGE